MKYALFLLMFCLPVHSVAYGGCRQLPEQWLEHSYCPHGPASHVGCVLPLIQDVAAASPAEADKPRVKILYIIPADRGPREGYAELIERMAAIARDYYEDHTGLTFEYSEPLFELVYSEHTAAAIETGDFVEGGQSDPGVNMFWHFSNLLMQEYYHEHFVENTLFLGITELPHWSAWGGSGRGHIGGVEFGTYARTGSNVHLQAWVHELGHAFGLGHAENSAYCAASYGADAFPFDSIMYWQVDYRQLEDKPLMFYEAEWLVDPEHPGQDCLQMRGRRPHPYEYFRPLDLCELSSDVDADGTVGLSDLSRLLTLWGPCPESDPSCRAVDLDCDELVGLDDLSRLLSDWGPVD